MDGRLRSPWSWSGEESAGDGVFGLGCSTVVRCADLDRLEEKSGFAEVGMGGLTVASGACRGFVA